MTCQGIPLATKGIISCPSSTPSGCTRYVLPFNLRLETDALKLNLKYSDKINLNALLDKKKLSLIKIPEFQLNNKIPSLKLNLKKCEE